MTSRVVLVEDDPTVRSVIEILLSTEPDLELVGTALSAPDGIRLVAELVPDVVLLDNQLEGAMTGVQAAPSMKAAAPSVVVLLCTALDFASVAAREPSIDGYLRKDNLVHLVDHVRGLLAQRGSR
ncbi:MAG: bacterial regulatory s, luxR family protein [Frankiales bacterium]|nr:bacterial regulatory s, luxR family protein [Frankiales bacterium]